MNNSVKRNCGTCEYLVVRPDSLGRRILRKDTAYRCLFQPDLKSLVLPSSMVLRLERRSFMEPREGAECPAWVPFVKKEAAG